MDMAVAVLFNDLPFFFMIMHGSVAENVTVAESVLLKTAGHLSESVKPFCFY
ncbi:hypothetical protein [Acinetobacter chinensis]|uniref:hypothetical protein n=1 Tax=Acinetobacter chinensis TaxID=2004650 RepID=UPI00135BF02A|nr:hypothetical protein [Acinetobacter chinensis]